MTARIACTRPGIGKLARPFLLSYLKRMKGLGKHSEPKHLAPRWPCLDRALEGVCELHGIQQKSFDLSLKKMQEDGLIEGRLWDWAQTLRKVRNAAAHVNGERVTKQDAEDSLAFCEALSDYLYVRHSPDNRV